MNFEFVSRFYFILRKYLIFIYFIFLRASLCLLGIKKARSVLSSCESYRLFFHYFFPLKLASLNCHAAPGTMELVLQNIDEEFKDKKKIRVANLGGGMTGKIFESHGIKVENYDISPESNDVIYHDLNAPEDISPNLKYNCVVAQEVIEHIENPWLFFRKCNKILYDNGLLIITTPNCHSLVSRFKFLTTSRFKWFEEKDIEYHINPLFLWEIENIAKKNGFILKSTKGNSEFFFKYSKSSKRPILASESLVFILRKESSFTLTSN